MQQGYQCPQCGATVAFGAKFCGNCGTQVNWPVQQMQPLPQYQQTNQDLRTHNEPQEALLLLLRPSLSQIFVIPPDSPPIDADGISTNYGMYNTKGINKHALERLLTLCISENGSVGYTIPMRLDLYLCLERLASSSKPPVDFPLGLFTNRDVIVVSQGLYTVQLCFNNPQDAIKALNSELNEFPASKIIYAATTTDEGTMANLRRLEATAKHLLSLKDPEANNFAKLPPDIASGWQHDFLEPIFKRAKASGQ